MRGTKPTGGHSAAVKLADDERVNFPVMEAQLDNELSAPSEVDAGSTAFQAVRSVPSELSEQRCCDALSETLAVWCDEAAGNADAAPAAQYELPPGLKRVSPKCEGPSLTGGHSAAEVRRAGNERGSYPVLDAQLDDELSAPAEAVRSVP